MLRILNQTDFAKLITIEELTQIVPWTLETFERCWQAGYIGWVVEQGEDVIGFIIITVHSGESHILNLGVHPDYHRQGFGEQLLGHALDISKNKGVGIAFLEVRRSNIPAIRLYEKFGFIQIGERKAYYPTGQGREDALVLAKDLS